MSIETRSILDGRVTLLEGDVREALAAMEPDSVDCVVTSPPYWGLRDYGVEGQIGLERTLGEHLDVMVDVFRAVRRVMKPQGTLWLNYGDCYATSPNGRSAADTKAAGNDDRTFRDKPFSTIGPIHPPASGNPFPDVPRRGGGNNPSGGTLKPKDLCMIPNRLAIALQEDGWWVRSEIIWGKTNPMPDSSGRYRPSTAHEKIFMLAKSGKCFYDSESVAVRRKTVDDTKKPDGWNTAHGAHGSFHPEGREKGARADKQHGHSRRHQGFNDRWDSMPRAEQQANGRFLRNYEPADVDVWPIAPYPFSEAHFATFPPELATRCIKAGCPESGLVLDPFGGAGTTAMVAAQLGRRATLIELNPDYCRLAIARIEAAMMGEASGARHMAAHLGRAEAAGPLFAQVAE
jgi:DNA modification methylase